MAKPSLLIDIGADTVCAGLLIPGDEKPSGLEYVSVTPEEGLKAALRGVISSIEGRGGVKEIPAGVDEVYVTLHPGYLHLRMVEVPFADRRKINEVLPYELEGKLSVAVSEVMIDSVPLAGAPATGGSEAGGKNRVLAVTIEKVFLRDLLDTLKALGLDPVWVGPALFMAPHLMKELYGIDVGAGGVGGEATLITEDFLALSIGTSPVFFNTFEGREGLRLSAAYLSAEGLITGRVCYTGWESETIAQLIPGSTVIEKLALPGGLPPEALDIYCLWLGVTKGVLKDTVNFRHGEFEYTGVKERLKKKLLITAALLVLIIAFASGHYYIKYIALAGELRAYSEALSQSYRGLFPQEKPPTDALYALNIKLNELEKEASVVSGDVKVLDLMKTLAVVPTTEQGPDVTITELQIAAGKVKAKGQAVSFESANRYKDLLAGKGVFKDVTLSDVKSRPGGGAAFSLTIDMG